MMGRAISGSTDVVIGRKLWQEWSQSWPNADASDPFGQFISLGLQIEFREQVQALDIGEDRVMCDHWNVQPHRRGRHPPVSLMIL